MFSGSGNVERLMGILFDVRVCRKSKMAAINRKYVGNISACIHDSKEIPTAIPMFLGSGYMIRLLRVLFDVRICENSKMAVWNRK